VSSKDRSDRSDEADNRPEVDPEVEDREEALFDPDEDVEPRITLDRYLSKRRPQPKGGWMHIASLVAMLVGLIMIMMYKEQCGRHVSQIFGTQSVPGSTGNTRKSTPVRYQLPPASAPSKPGLQKPTGARMNPTGAKMNPTGAKMNSTGAKMNGK